VAGRSVSRVARATPSGGLVTVARVVGAVVAYLVAFIGSSILLYGLDSLLPDQIGSTFAIVALGIAEGVALLTVLGVWVLVDRRPIVQLGLNRRGAARRWIRGAVIAALDDGQRGLRRLHAGRRRGVGGQSGRRARLRSY
jgi:hypothetical protein